MAACTPSDASLQPEVGRMATWATLCERYDGFIFDQFGVMHNGAVALPGAPELISRLKKMGKRLVILSNSSKRAKWSMNELSKYQIDSAAFMGVVTSGEEAWHALCNNWAGRRCLWLAKSDGSGVTDYLHGTGVYLASIDDADMILCTGTNTIRDGDSILQVDCETTGDLLPYRVFFERGVAKGVPLICANPDFISPAKPGSKETFQPGHVARFYEELGGTVIYYGKPHKEHFDACVHMLGLDRSRFAHVGDSMHHDVRGALRASLSVIFVAGGIEHDELGIALGETPTAERLEELCARFGAIPTHVVELARWTE